MLTSELFETSHVKPDFAALAKELGGKENGVTPEMLEAFYKMRLAHVTPRKMARDYQHVS